MLVNKFHKQLANFISNDMIDVCNKVKKQREIKDIMSEILLEIDAKANHEICELMKHYKMKSRADLISKALTFMKIAATVDQTNGELIARKGTQETRLKLI